MDTKTIMFFLLGWLVVFIVAGCDCQEDEFGEVLHIQIPIDVGTERNLFQVGDTLWVKANFPKQIDVIGHQNDIFLEDFIFFSGIIIAEISTDTPMYYTTDQIVVRAGEVDVFFLGGYVYSFEESADGYRLDLGIVLNVPGIYSTTGFTDANEQSRYSHPALFTCGDNLRTNLFIDRVNRYSTPENFADYIDWGGVENNGFNSDFEGYRSIGAYTFRVVE